MARHAGQMAGPARLAKAGDGVIVAVPEEQHRPTQIANRNQQDYDDRPAWFEIMRGLEVLASLPQPPGKFPS